MRRHRPYPLERDTWRTKSGATWTVVDAGLTHQRQCNRVVTLVCQCGARLALSPASFLRRFILVKSPRRLERAKRDQVRARRAAAAEGT